MKHATNPPTSLVNSQAIDPEARFRASGGPAPGKIETRATPG